jgi:hypothetical protein
MRALLIALTIALAPPAFAQTEAQVEAKDAVERDLGADALQILIGQDRDRRTAVARLVEYGEKDIIPTLVLVMRITGNYTPVGEALSTLTGEKIETWREAMLWQEKHPEIVPHESYRALKLRWFSSIDRRFLTFFDGEMATREKMKIRLEEITWGGVRVDGIPSLDNPDLIAATSADYMRDDDLVFGASINGDARAYPLRIMGWHEMFNEVIGGVPVALAYCTLCGSGILFETTVEGRDEPLVFGSSGFLYRSNKLMFDRATNSLWNQFTGEPVSGPLVDAGIKLKIRPVTITSWKRWREKNPQTQVLDVDTGHIRDYGSGVVYRDYFASPDLMFPTIVRDESVLKRKDYVFGIRDFGAARAWPITAFEGGKVINDAVGSTNVVLIGDAATRTVRAYERGALEFSAGSDASTISGPGGEWQITEDALTGPAGESLPRAPGHIAYWFAWGGYLGVKSSLYGG